MFKVSMLAMAATAVDAIGIRIRAGKKDGKTMAELWQYEASHPDTTNCLTASKEDRCTPISMPAGYKCPGSDKKIVSSGAKKYDDEYEGEGDMFYPQTKSDLDLFPFGILKKSWDYANTQCTGPNSMLCMKIMMRCVTNGAAELPGIIRVGPDANNYMEVPLADMLTLQAAMTAGTDSHSSWTKSMESRFGDSSKDSGLHMVVLVDGKKQRIKMSGPQSKEFYGKHVSLFNWAQFAAPLRNIS
jgi:hypothetical protein